MTCSCVLTAAAMTSCGSSSAASNICRPRNSIAGYAGGRKLPPASAPLPWHLTVTRTCTSALHASIRGADSATQPQGGSAAVENRMDNGTAVGAKVAAAPVDGDTDAPTSSKALSPEANATQNGAANGARLGQAKQTASSAAAEDAEGGTDAKGSEDRTKGSISGIDSSNGALEKPSAGGARAVADSAGGQQGAAESNGATASGGKAQEKAQATLQAKGAAEPQHITLQQARAMVADAVAAQEAENRATQSQLARMQLMLEGAVSEREDLERELRQAMAERVAQEKKNKSALRAAAAAEARLEEQRAAAEARFEEQRAAAEARFVEQQGTAGARIHELEAELKRLREAKASEHVFTAGLQIEGRLDAAYADKYRDELECLKEQLRYAMRVATEAEESAAVAAAASELQVVKVVDAALGALQEETEAELKLALSAATSARDAAAASSLAARGALKGQLDALAAAMDIQAEATMAHQRAAASHAEARTLGREVSTLRKQLAAAHEEAGEAARSAAAAEAKAARRAAAAETAAQRRTDEAVAVFEALKASQTKRADAAEERAAHLATQLTDASAEVERLRKTLQEAQTAQADAEARWKQAEDEFAARVEALETQAAEAIDAAKKELAVEREQLLLGARDADTDALAAMHAELGERLQAAMDKGRVQLEAVYRALAAVTTERDYWRKRSEQLTSLLADAQAKLEDESAAASSARQVASREANGRLRAALSHRRVWGLIANGTRQPDEPPQMQPPREEQGEEGRQGLGYDLKASSPAE